MTTAQRVLLWTPRILAMLFAAFISVFAFDVFEEPQSLGRQLLDLALHLVPTFVLLLILALAWRWEWVGTVAYALLGVLYLWQFGAARGWPFPWSVYALLPGSLFLIAALFFASGRMRRRQRAGVPG